MSFPGELHQEVVYVFLAQKMIAGVFSNADSTFAGDHVFVDQAVVQDQVGCIHGLSGSQRQQLGITGVRHRRSRRVPLPHARSLIATKIVPSAILTG
jgi:hypothetical protein